MPESPDFDATLIKNGFLMPDFEQIARRIVHNGANDEEEDTAFIAEQLRQIWNVRGAADSKLLTEEFNEAPPDLVASAIRSLDR
jgi:hypothetical protein